MSVRSKRHSFEEESGFTLPEMLVTILILITVLFALYSIFDISIRLFSVGNNEVEATENARVAVERMAREVRAAYPSTSAANAPVLENAMTNSGRITFWNQLTSGGTPTKISYYVNSGNLVRQAGAGTPDPVAVLGPGGALEFKYFHKTTGAEITNPSADETNIGMVRIKLVVDEGGRTQELITNVALRNRSG